MTVPAPTSPQPFDARVGQEETATITATASYASGSSVSKSVTDVTTVVGGSLSLLKTAVTFDGAQPAPTACSSTLNRVDRNNNNVQGDDANPGDFLCYTVVAENRGNSALERVVVSDALNSFTDFVSVSAVGAGYGAGSGVLYSNKWHHLEHLALLARGGRDRLRGGRYERRQHHHERRRDAASCQADRDLCRKGQVNGLVADLTHPFSRLLRSTPEQTSQEHHLEHHEPNQAGA